MIRQLPACTAIPASPAAAAARTVPGPIVGRSAAVPVRLLELDQHAARALAAQARAARQQLIGALHRLHPEHETLLHDHRLTDVQIPQARRDPDALGDVARRDRVRPCPGQQRSGHQ